jgi:hypothetical protein
MTRTVWPKEALTSETMNFLDGIHQEWCSAARCGRSSNLGMAKAKALVDWFEFGVRDRDELLGLLSEDFSGAA